MKQFKYYFNNTLPKRLLGLGWKRKYPYFEIFKEVAKYGSLYIMVEAKNVSGSDKYLIRDTIEEMKNRYDGTEKGFKRAVGWANYSFSDIRERISNISMSILEISDESLLKFSKYGKIKTFVIRDEIYELNPENNSNDHFFQNIYQGRLMKRDRVIIMTADLFDQIWNKDIFNYIEEADSIKKLKKLLKTNKNFFNQFNGFLLKIFITKNKIPFYKKTKISKKILPIVLLIFLILLFFVIKKTPFGDFLILVQ